MKNKLILLSGLTLLSITHVFADTCIEAINIPTAESTESVYMNGAAQFSATIMYQDAQCAQEMQKDLRAYYIYPMAGNGAPVMGYVTLSSGGEIPKISTTNHHFIPGVYPTVGAMAHANQIHAAPKADAVAQSMRSGANLNQSIYISTANVDKAQNLYVGFCTSGSGTCATYQQDLDQDNPTQLETDISDNGSQSEQPTAVNIQLANAPSVSILQNMSLLLQRTGYQSSLSNGNVVETFLPEAYGYYDGEQLAPYPFIHKDYSLYVRIGTSATKYYLVKNGQPQVLPNNRIALGTAKLQPGYKHKNSRVATQPFFSWYISNQRAQNAHSIDAQDGVVLSILNNQSVASSERAKKPALYWPRFTSNNHVASIYTPLASSADIAHVLYANHRATTPASMYSTYYYLTHGDPYQNGYQSCTRKAESLYPDSPAAQEAWIANNCPMASGMPMDNSVVYDAPSAVRLCEVTADEFGNPIKACTQLSTTFLPNTVTVVDGDASEN